jgi:hypothetical protein
VIADRRSGRSLSDAVVVSKEQRQVVAFEVKEARQR